RRSSSSTSSPFFSRAARPASSAVASDSTPSARAAARAAARSSSGAVFERAESATWLGDFGIKVLPWSGSRPDLTRSPDEEAGGGQFAQAHRTVRVELGGGDADLGAET